MMDGFSGIYELDGEKVKRKAHNQMLRLASIRLFDCVILKTM